MPDLSKMLLNTDFAAGYRAGLRGESLYTCNYKEADRYVKWASGWHNGKIQRQKEKYGKTSDQ